MFSRFMGMFCKSEKKKLKPKKSDSHVRQILSFFRVKNKHTYEFKQHVFRFFVTCFPWFQDPEVKMRVHRYANNITPIQFQEFVVRLQAILQCEVTTEGYLDFMVVEDDTNMVSLQVHGRCYRFGVTNTLTATKVLRHIPLKALESIAKAIRDVKAV